MKKYHPLAYIEISKKNLIQNIRQFKNLTKKGTELSLVVKGNAYGHGLKEIVKAVSPYVNFFQVDSVEELAIFRETSQKKVFLFGYVQQADLKQAIKLGCILTSFSLHHLAEINKTAQKLKKIQEVHLPVDAYLGREGFLLSELPKVLRKIKNYKFIKLTGLYAHFANIEDTQNFSHAKKQIEEYARAITIAKKLDYKKLLTHISATSGFLAYEKSSGINPLIRLGIGMYGLWPSRYLRELYKKTKFNLKPVLAWKTKVAQVKILPKGRTIGYGLTYKTKKRTKIAIIPQGYADGFERRFSNNGFVLIRGIKCKILGRIMMNMFVVDVSHLKKVESEDEVVLLGTQGKNQITAEELAVRINTINYEIVTRITPLLPRLIK